MTKVRVCVGVNKQGAYYSHGSITIPDKEAEVIVRGKLRNDPEVSVSFHDLEVMTPQAPVVEALSSEGHTLKRGDKVTRMQLGKLETWQVVEPTPDADGMIVLLVEGMELRANDTWAVLVEQLGKFSCGYHYRMSYEDDCTLVPEVTAPQGLKPGDMVVDQQNLLWDVDHVAEGTEAVAWLTSPALEGTRIAAVHTLKKVVFGTL